jgi:hypothetical protein
MVGFIDRIRARMDRRRNPNRPVPMAAEQTANVAQLGAQAGQAGGQYQDAYGALGGAKAGFDALAAGEGPSLAQAQLEAQSGRNIASQMALAGQARGGNLSGMAQAAQATGAGMALQTNQQMAELRAQEQLAAMQGAAGLAGQMAGMSSDRQLGMMGMGQQALGSQVDRDMAWRLAQQDARQRQRESNRAFGLGVVDRGLGAVEAGAGMAGTFSDRDLKQDIKRAKSPIAMLLLAKPEADECPSCGRAGCEAEHETESMGRGDDPSVAKRLAARKAFKKLRSYEYEYTDEGRDKGMPGGKVVGVMAQDLEKSEAGRELVSEKKGRKWIDGRKALSLVLAGAADHEQRLAALEKRRAG